MEIEVELPIILVLRQVELVEMGMAFYIEVASTKVVGLAKGKELKGGKGEAKGGFGG